MELIHAEIRHFYLNNLSLLGINLKTIVSNYGNKETKKKTTKQQTNLLGSFFSLPALALWSYC